MRVSAGCCKARLNFGELETAESVFVKVGGREAALELRQDLIGGVVVHERLILVDVTVNRVDE